MEQLDFGEKNRYVRLDDKKDPLVRLNAIIPWEMFRPLPAIPTIGVLGTSC